MRLTIDDRISGKERRRLLKVLPALHGLKRCKNKIEAAKWLGISIRGLRLLILEHPELAPYRQHQKPEKVDYHQILLDSLLEEDLLKYADDLDRVKNSAGWRYGDKQERTVLLKKVWAPYLKKIE